MRCSVLPDRVAVWCVKTVNLRLSALAAELLVEKQKTTWKDLRLVRRYEWSQFEGPGGPVTGAGAALVNSAGGIVKGVGGMPVKWAKSIKKERHDEREKKRRSLESPRENSEPRINGEVNDLNSEKNSGELSHGGQHGAEKHLPEPHCLPGRAYEAIEKEKQLENGVAPRPAPSKRYESSEDAVSISSGILQDHLAQDLAEDTGNGFAKTGEALAKGIPSHKRLVSVISLTRFQSQWISPLPSLRAFTTLPVFAVTRPHALHLVSPVSNQVCAPPAPSSRSASTTASLAFSSSHTKAPVTMVRWDSCRKSAKASEVSF